MNKYWFKPKKYGWGFTPITWEGWLVTVLLAIVILALGYVIGLFSDTATWKEGVRFLVVVLIVSVLVSWLFLPKTKGKVKWRWGGLIDR